MAEVIEGFEEDFNKLLTNFGNEKCVRFTTFAKLWREMHFSLVYCGRGLRNMIVFTTEAFALVLKLMVETDSFQLRVGALYVLYGLYFKQPVVNMVKIRVTLRDWSTITHLIKDSKDNSHFDTLYIIIKMIICNAFDLSLFNRKIHHCLRSKAIEQHKVVEIDFMDEEIDLNNCLNSLKNIEANYMFAKQQLPESNSVPSYSNDSLTDCLTNILMKEPNAEFEMEANIPNESILGINRRDLKEKCFYSPVSADSPEDDPF